MDAINALYHSDGVVFVDPTFPPIPRSLYMHPDGHKTFKVRCCEQSMLHILIYRVNRAKLRRPSR